MKEIIGFPHDQTCKQIPFIEKSLTTLGSCGVYIYEHLGTLKH